MTAELSSINPNSSLRGVVVSLPVKPIKAPVDAETLALKYGDAMHKHGMQCLIDARSRHPAYDDLGGEAPDFEPLREEIERLKCADYDLGEILETTRALLLVLSQPKVMAAISSLGAHEPEAVERFCSAVDEAKGDGDEGGDSDEDDSYYCQGCNPEPTMDELDCGTCASCGKSLA